MKFTIPRNLDLEKLLLSNDTILLKKRTTVDGKRLFKPVRVKTSTLLKHIPYCYYLIDLIIKKTVNSKDTVKGYVNLRSELLDEVIPHITRKLVTNLLSVLKVIEVNNTYCIGDYSKSYRITNTYPLTDLVTITINNDSSIKGRYIGESTTDDNSTIKGYYIGELNNKDIYNSSTGRCGYPYVVSFLKKVNKVEQGVKKVRENKTNDLINNHVEYRFQQDQIFNINLDYDDILVDGKLIELSPLIEKISNGDDGLSINVNNKVNRVFSPITNLKKEHRKYLRCKHGYSLLSIDFKTSHLFHLLKKIVDLNASNEPLLNEVERVKQIAADDIYLFVAGEYQKAFNKPITRDEAKNLFIERFLYGKYPNRKMSQWIKSLFPAITEFIGKLYTRREISIALQKSESYLLNNRIFKRIAQETDDGITAFGLFDSVLVDQNHFDQVYNIMMEESEKYFGYGVPLSTDDLSVGKEELQLVETV